MVFCFQKMQRKTIKYNTMKSYIASFVVALVFLSCCSVSSSARTTRPTTTNNTTMLSPNVDGGGICSRIIEPLGYKCEEHTVTTSDGYILSMQRIPASRSGQKAQKPPVLLQHGLFVDAICWLLNPPDQALSYMLADNGHDVWLSNFRGTKYSRSHKSLNTFSTSYWDWSWDELSANDLTSFVEYVYKTTGQKLHYVGHSMGTTVMLAALSENRLVTMLRSAALLSPVAYMNQIPAPLSKALAAAIEAEQVYWLGLREVNPKLPVYAELVGNLCENLHMDCRDIFTPFTGPNCCLNSSVVKPMIDNELQPTAAKNLIHFSQMITSGGSGTVTKFDYTLPSLNIAHYGQPSPPVYDMSRIPNDFPLYFSYGSLDLLSDPKDVQTLLDSLKGHNQDMLKVQLVEKYAHADFVLAVDANQIVFTPLMDFFSRH